MNDHAKRIAITHDQAELSGERQRTQRDARAETGEFIAQALGIPVVSPEQERAEFERAQAITIPSPRAGSGDAQPAPRGGSSPKRWDAELDAQRRADAAAAFRGVAEFIERKKS